MPEVNPVNAEVDEAEPEATELGVAVGVEVQVKAPVDPTVILVAKQKEIVVDAPFATTEPLRVAVVAPMDVGSFVVAIGRPATIVNVRFFPADVVG